MTPGEKLHAHHERLIGTIQGLAERTKSDTADASLLITFCNEYLVSHAGAEEVTLYKADTDTDFVKIMLREHGEIKDTLEAISNAFAKGDPVSVVSETGNFITTLHEHFDEEENRLMPKLSKSHTQQQLADLIEEAHRVEDEKKRSDLWSLFEQDHKRIDFNISRLRKSIGSPEVADGLYSKVRAQLLKHIELEESVLFPAFGEHADSRHMGPVQVMISEHREITSLLGLTPDMLHDKSRSSNFDSLVGKLSAHNKKEELILYPMINNTLPAVERANIFKECFNGLASVNPRNEGVAAAK